MIPLLLAVAAVLSPAPGVRLADERGLPRQVFLVAAETPTVPEPMTRAQLSANLLRLEETRPSLGLPLAMALVGMPLGITGTGALVSGIMVSRIPYDGRVPSTRIMNPMQAMGVMIAVVGALVLSVGLLLAIVGGKWLGLRRGHLEQIEAARQQLDAVSPEHPVLQF